MPALRGLPEPGVMRGGGARGARGARGTRFLRGLLIAGVWQIGMWAAVWFAVRHSSLWVRR